MKKTYLLSLALLFSALSYSQVINTVIGTSFQGNMGDGGPATAATIDDPVRVVIDKAGNIYVAQPHYNNIRMVNKVGIISLFAGAGMGFGGDGGPATAALFNFPSDLCLDDSGNLYVMDAGNYRIRKINKLGIIITVAGNGTDGSTGDGGSALSGQIGCGGITVDDTGNLYIAQSYHNNIRKISKSGILYTIAGNSTMGYWGDGGPALMAEFNTPEDVAFDNKGNMYIADVGNNSIRKVDITGTITTVAGNGLAGYSGDSSAATSAEMYYPTGVSIDPAGNLYITDAYNNCIRKVAYATGIITTIAGNTSAGFGGDGGPATNALLNTPVNTTFDSAGNMYIADYGNYAVRKVDNEFVLGINNTAVQNDASIYPNPNKGEFTLSINNYQLGINNYVEIYNSLGEKIYSTAFGIQHSKLNINLSNEPDGAYFYRIISANGNTVSNGKFIIER